MTPRMCWGLPPKSEKMTDWNCAPEGSTWIVYIDWKQYGYGYEDPKEPGWTIVHKSEFNVTNSPMPRTWQLA